MDLFVTMDGEAVEPDCELRFDPDRFQKKIPAPMMKINTPAATGRNHFADVSTEVEGGGGALRD